MGSCAGGIQSGTTGHSSWEEGLTPGHCWALKHLDHQPVGIPVQWSFLWVLG